MRLLEERYARGRGITREESSERRTVLGASPATPRATLALARTERRRMRNSARSRGASDDQLGRRQRPVLLLPEGVA